MIKVTVRDSIGSDLFDVSFNDNLVSALTKYIKPEDIVKFKGDSMDYEIVGSKYIMSHVDLMKIINEMAL